MHLAIATLKAISMINVSSCRHDAVNQGALDSTKKCTTDGHAARQHAATHPSWRLLSAVGLDLCSSYI